MCVGYGASPGAEVRRRVGAGRVGGDGADVEEDAEPLSDRSDRARFERAGGGAAAGGAGYLGVPARIPRPGGSDGVGGGWAAGRVTERGGAGVKCSPSISATTSSFATYSFPE